MPGKNNRIMTTEERDEMKRLFELGWSPIEISREVHRTGPTVVNQLRAMGFRDARLNERPIPAAASDKEVRLLLKRKLHQEAATALENIHRPYTRWEFDVRSGDFVGKRVLPEPREVNDYMRTAVLAIDQAVKLDAYDTSDSASELRSMMGGLLTAFELATPRLLELSGQPPIELNGEKIISAAVLKEPQG